MSHPRIEEEADNKESYQWLEKAGLKYSTKSLIRAAQEEVCRTRVTEMESATPDRTPGAGCANLRGL